jgi:glycerate 2-kinase
VDRTRHHALQIFRAALQAADPERAVLKQVSFEGSILKAGRKHYNLGAFDRVQVIGAGKASAAMARAIEKVLGRRIAGGCVNVPDGTSARLRRIELHPCGHPIPDERGVEGARRILEIASASGPRDLLICVISGGASALMPAPSPPLTLLEKQAITRKLLASGATIHEINAVRKHLSLIKGGQLARLAYPATVVSLLLSDVVGDDAGVIGSGPTVADPSTCADAVGFWRDSESTLRRRLFMKRPSRRTPVWLEPNRSWSGATARPSARRLRAPASWATTPLCSQRRSKGRRGKLHQCMGPSPGKSLQAAGPCGGRLACSREERRR